MNTVDKAKLALKHRLYSQPNWCLIQELRSCVRNDGVGYKISLRYEGDIPVSIALLKTKTRQVQAFTRKCCRGKGHASLAIKEVVGRRKKCWGANNSPSNGKIFEYNGLRVVNWRC